MPNNINSIKDYRKISLKKYRADFVQNREAKTTVINPNDRLLGVGPVKKEWSKKIDDRTEVKWKGVEVGGKRVPTDKVELKFKEDHFTDKNATIKKISTEHTLFLNRLGIDGADYDLFLGSMKLPASVVTGLEAGYESATKFETDNFHIIIKPGVKAYAKADASVLAGRIEGLTGKKLDDKQGYVQITNDELDKGLTAGVRVEVGVRLSFGIEIFRFIDNKMRAQGMFSITIGFSVISIGSNVELALTMKEKDMDGEKMGYISKYIGLKSYIGFDFLNPYAIIEGAFNKAIFVDKNDDGIRAYLMDLVFGHEKNFILKAASDLLPSQEYLGLRIASLKGVPMAPKFEDLTNSLRASREYLWSASLDEGKSSYLRGLEELIETINKQYGLLYNDFINEKYPYKTVAELPSNLAKDDHDSAQWIFYGRRRLGTFCKRSIESLGIITQRHEQHLAAINRELGMKKEVDLTNVPPLVRTELMTWMHNNTIQLGETNGIIDKKTLIGQLENAIRRQKKFKITLEGIFSNLLYGQLDKGNIGTKASEFIDNVYYTLDGLKTDFGNLINYDRYNRAHTFIENMRSQRNYMEGEIGKIINSNAANIESNPDARYIFKMFKAYINEYLKLDLRSLEKDLNDQTKYEKCMNIINLERNSFQKLVNDNNQKFNQILNDQTTILQTKNYFNRLHKMLNSGLLTTPNPKPPTLD